LKGLATRQYGHESIVRLETFRKLQLERALRTVNTMRPIKAVQFFTIWILPEKEVETKLSGIFFALSDKTQAIALMGLRRVEKMSSSLTRIYIYKEADAFKSTAMR